MESARASERRDVSSIAAYDWHFYSVFPDEKLTGMITSDFAKVYAKSIEAQEKLISSANAYLQKNKQDRIDLAKDGDWLTTKTRMNQASLALDKILSKRRDMTGFTGRLRRCFNILCENAGVGRIFVSVIPDDLMLTSGICGGLNVIFNALEQHGIHESAVLRALEDLPPVLSTHEAYAEAAAQDVRIHELTDSLYVAVCEVLDQILAGITQKVACESTRFILIMYRASFCLMLIFSSSRMSKWLLRSGCSSQNRPPRNWAMPWQTFVRLLKISELIPWHS